VQVDVVAGADSAAGEADRLAVLANDRPVRERADCEFMAPADVLVQTQHLRAVGDLAAGLQGGLGDRDVIVGAQAQGDFGKGDCRHGGR